MSLIPDALRAPPAAPPIEDEALMRETYRRWRVRMMVSMLIGYASFYLVRKNFSMAMPAFLEELNMSRTDLGIILSAFSILYGAGKFLNGMLADRANARWFMVIGLTGAALANFAFGLSSSLLFFGIFWLVNAWFQSMGWPPCARLLTFWYSPRERGTMWGLWNASHQVGGALILVGGGYLITTLGWRAAFYVPAAAALLLALFLAAALRDSPASLGLPPVEEYRGEAEPDSVSQEAPPSLRHILLHHVLSNKLIWYVCLANMFVYFVRIGMLDWGPTFLVEAKGSALAEAGWKVAAFEVAGIFGAIVAGLFSDRLLKGRRGPVSIAFMVLSMLSVVALWKIPPGHPWLDTFALIGVGFAIYGPQMLVGVAAADFASKHAAATATGLTGTFGYIGSALCGVGTGVVVDRWGGDGGFLLFLISSLLACVFFALTWNARAAVLTPREGTEAHRAVKD